MPTLLIVDDHFVVRSGLVASLELEDDLLVVSEVERGEDVIAAYAKHRPDIVLMDVQLPGISGIEAIAEITKRSPSAKSIVLTTFGRPGYLRSALDAGAVGFMVKDAPASELATAIRNVHNGGRAIDPELAMAALSLGPNPLTPRQREVLRLTRLGLPVGTMARRLSLTEGTVRNYLSEAISATGAENRFDAVRIAESSGWLE